MVGSETDIGGRRLLEPCSTGARAVAARAEEAGGRQVRPNRSEYRAFNEPDQPTTNALRPGYRFGATAHRPPLGLSTRWCLGGQRVPFGSPATIVLARPKFRAGGNVTFWNPRRGGPGPMATQGSAALAAAPELAPIELYTAESRIVGWIAPNGQRVTDLLCSQDELRLWRPSPGALDETSEPSANGRVPGDTGEWESLPTAQVILAMPPEWRASRQLRLHRRLRRAAVIAGPFSVTGNVHLPPGAEVGLHLVRGQTLRAAHRRLHPAQRRAAVRARGQRRDRQQRPRRADGSARHPRLRDVATEDRGHNRGHGRPAQLARSRTPRRSAPTPMRCTPW